jgi:hypothetical protein
LLGAIFLLSLLRGLLAALTGGLTGSAMAELYASCNPNLDDERCRRS